MLSDVTLAFAAIESETIHEITRSITKQEIHFVLFRGSSCLSAFFALD
jgi:hypothetical protein